MTTSALPFDPLVGRWFSEKYGAPTEVQSLAWPRIAAGEHVLAVAPTGSGKTLAAFLWAIDRLLTGAWEAGATRVVYVTPLKALGNDVQRNLLGPLADLRASFIAAGRGASDVRVLIRTGDTPSYERQRMRRRPPEILITTPESLNILLTSRSGRVLLNGVRAVMLDEIHALIGNKRGTQLSVNLERLAAQSGEIQRIALSATVQPIETVAAWLGGGTTARPRAVSTVVSRAPKRYEVSVDAPMEDLAAPSEIAAGGPWPGLVRSIRDALAKNRSTLIFANSRRMVEKLTRLLLSAGEDRIYAHHGSLAREIRGVIEERFKRGELRGIVATHSLELGIDIGDLDEVVLVQAPTSLASATQRIGRAGHGVGEISRARFLSIAPRDLLDAAVIARGVREGALEAARPIDGALDVLAQTIVATVATKSWRRAELYDVVTRSHAYRDLTRAQFDLVIAMLAGLSGARRLTAFKPLIFADSASDTLHALPGAETRLYLSGGTIPDRGYFHLRLADSGALIGELDEEFVWERSLGDSFSLGPQNWRIERVTRNDVFVTPTARGAAMAPFWRAEERFRPRELMARTASFLSEAEQRLPDLAWRDEIMGACSLTAGALRSLLQFLAEQKAALDGHLPHQTQWIIERVRGGQEAQTILHTLAGGRVNHPLALMLQASASTARRGGERVETIVTDDAITFLGREDVDLQAWIDTALQSDPLTLVREGLPKTPIFGARFREAAQIALLLPRDGFERRTPLWLQRERAKQLLSSVAEHDDFPLMLEAWRACLQDVFDLDTLQETCDGLRAGRIRIHEAVTDHPSPFSAQSQWRRTNQLMYADDMPLSPQRVRTRMDLIREVALRPELRPTSDPKQADILRSKLQRTYPGYAPSDAIDLMALVEARVLVPLDEWQALLDACERDGQDRASWLAEIGDRLLLLERAGSEGIGCVTTEGALKRLWPLIDGTGRALEVRTLSGRATDAHSIAARAHDAPRSEASAESRTQTAADLIEAWLSHYGPISIDTPPSLLLLSDAVWQAALATLVDEERVIVGDLCGRGEELCVTANYERLVRQARTAARPTIVAQKVDRLPLYLATWQGLIRREAAGADEECLPAAIESLFGCPAPVALWETDLLPARVPDYRPADLDALLAEGDLVALGCGEERIAFVLESDRELFAREETEATQAIDASAIFPSTTGRYTFAELLAHSRRDSAGLTRALWSLLWQGRAITDGFEVIRRGIDGRFAPAEVADDARPRRMGRLSRSRWSASRPFGGTWRLLAPVAPPCDALEEDERSRERLRLLLNCYGIVFREIVEREWGGGSWARAFRSLRLMELSGEIVMGRFFEGIPGPQFAILQAIEVLTSGLDEGAVYAMNAVDPASPCGLSLAGTTAWPRRLPSTQMIFQGERLVLVAEQGGKKLAIRISADDERLGACLDPWIAQLTRAVRPLKALQIDTVNDIPAARSPYLAALEKLAQVVRDPLSVRLMRRYA